MKLKKFAVVLTLVLAAAMLSVTAFAAPSPETNLPDITVSVSGNTVASAATYASLSDAAKEAVPSDYTLAYAFTLAADAEGEVAITLDTGIAGAVLAQYNGTAWTTIATAGDDGVITANVTLSDNVVFGILAPVSATNGSAAATSTDTTGSTTDTTASAGATSPQTGETISTTAIALVVVFVGLAGVFTVCAYKRKSI